MDARSYVFNIFNMLSERSHLQEVTGTVTQICNKVCKFGYMVRRKLSSSWQLILVTYFYKCLPVFFSIEKNPQ